MYRLTKKKQPLSRRGYTFLGLKEANRDMKKKSNMNEIGRIKPLLAVGIDSALPRTIKQGVK